MKPRYWWLYILLLCTPLLFSCATYNMSMQSYYDEVNARDYDKALKTLESKKILKRNRNRLLYNLEAGRLHHLRKDYVKSNEYFNRADHMVENIRKSAGSIAVANILNPMHETYKGEDFEQFMMHYYKALNYSGMGLTEDAVVEARRISLASGRQNDKFNGKDNRYSKDAFALTLQGLLYESAGDINNAFISFRNAANIYLEAKGTYYGVALPAQLQQDLLRTALLMGFDGEFTHYAQLFNYANYQAPSNEGGELILFIEEGRAPVKDQKTIYLNAEGNGASFLYVNDEGADACYDFDYRYHGFSAADLTGTGTLKIALPAYKLQSLFTADKYLLVNGIEYRPQLLQDINSVATNILRERYVQEMAKAIARQLSKQLMQKGAEAIGEAAARPANKKNDSNSSTPAQQEEEKKKRRQKAEAAGEAAGFVMSLFNKATEKADTRNWQSLPAFISYVRIPLKEGENNIVLKTGGAEKNISVTGNGRMLIRSEIIN
ncbi:MAG: hypothetical protein WAT19_08970 [Ferruginibacter sp.]